MRTGSLWDLSFEKGVPSLTTIQKLVKFDPDFPVIRYGSRGRAYVVDLDAAGEFLRLRHAGGAIRPEAREIAKRELGLGLLGDGNA